MTAELSQASIRVPPAARPFIVLAGVAWAILAEAIRLEAGWPLAWVLADLLPGLAFLVVGVIAWRRRPGNRTGPLLFAIGISWFFGTWAASTRAPAHRPHRLRVPGLLRRAPRVGRSGLSLRSTHQPRRRPGSWWPRSSASSWREPIFRFAAYQGFRAYDFAIPSEADRYIADTTLRETGEVVFIYLIAAISIVVLGLIVVPACGRAHGRPGAASRVPDPPRRRRGPPRGILVEFATGSTWSRLTIGDRQFLAAHIGQYITSLTGAPSSRWPSSWHGANPSRPGHGRRPRRRVSAGSRAGTVVCRAAFARALGIPPCRSPIAVPGTAEFRSIADAAGPSGAAARCPRTDRAVTRLEPPRRDDRVP